MTLPDQLITKQSENNFLSKRNSNPPNPLETAREEHLLDPFVFVNGRRFVSGDPDLKTWRPNDPIETQRAYHQHYVYNRIWQGLITAPVIETLLFENARALDIGCGTGAWLMDMAVECPLSTFIGIDIICPDDLTKPPNAGFISGNLLDGVPFPEETFDYVHQRQLMSELPTKQWCDLVLHEMIRVTKPNGWIEADETTFKSQNLGPIGKELEKAMHEFTQYIGVDVNAKETMLNQFEKAGLVNLQSVEKNIPCGSWGGKFGQMILEDAIKSLTSLKVILPGRMGITDEEYMQKIEKYSHEVNEYRTNITIYRVWAQKPLVPLP
jgi:ubiquinone/menaquinone biosynthesis C-methylase UbiE